QRRDHADAVVTGLAHADDAAAADMDTGFAHVIERRETIPVGTGGDDLAVELGRRVEIVIVVIEPCVLEAARLRRREHAERRTGLEAECPDALDHGANAVEVAVLLLPPPPPPPHTGAAAGAFLPL